MTVTGGLDLWPADPAIPKADYTDSLTAEDVPFELLDAAEIDAALAAVAPRRRHDRDVAGPGRPGRPVQGQRRAPPAGHGPRRRRCATGRRSTPSATSGGGVEVETPAGRPTGAGRVVLTADAWTNQLLASFDRRLPLTVTKEQVTYFACPDPAAFAPGPLPGLDLDGRPVASTASRRTARPAQGRPGLSAARSSTPRPGRSSATRPPSRASHDFLAAPPARARSGRRS